MKRQIKKVGDLLLIPLPNEHFSVGLVLKEKTISILDFYENRIPSGEEILYLQEIFHLVIYDNELNSVRWIRIDLGLNNHDYDLSEPYFIHRDTIFRDKFQIYRNGEGFILNPFDSLPDLEPLLVWNIEGVEKRIIDYFEGRPNKTLEHYK